MSCCGNRRAALGRALQPITPDRAAWRHPPAAPAQARQPAGAVRLSYVGPVPVMLPSPSGGGGLWLHSRGQVVEADAKQAQALLRTGWFETPAA